MQIIYVSGDYFPQKQQWPVEFYFQSGLMTPYKNIKNKFQTAL